MSTLRSHPAVSEDSAPIMRLARVSPTMPARLVAGTWAACVARFPPIVVCVEEELLPAESVEPAAVPPLNEPVGCRRVTLSWRRLAPS